MTPQISVVAVILDLPRAIEHHAPDRGPLSEILESVACLLYL